MSESDGVWQLDARMELRFEVSAGTTLKVRLDKGNAEVFGVPMVVNEDYSFPEGKYAAFTWYGCTISLSDGEPQSVYKSDTTTMMSSVSIHGNLDMQREIAIAQSSSGDGVGSPEQRGPRVMVVGLGDSGKSTLCKILLAYAVRRGRKPVFVDLDPGQSMVSVPGTLSAATLDESSLSVPLGLVPHNPISYFYGHTTPSENPEHFKRIIQLLADSVNKRFAVDPVSRCSGMVVNTCGWIDPGTGYDLLLFAAKAFAVDVVIVMDHGRLLNDLRRDLEPKAPSASPAVDGMNYASALAKEPAPVVAPPTKVNVIKIARSSGVDQRSSAYRRKARETKIKQYFEGIPGEEELSPSRIVLDFDQVKIFTIQNTSRTGNEATLPVGQQSSLDPNEPVPVTISPQLKYSILGLSHASKEEDIIKANLCGLVHVIDVDMEEKKVSLLAPCPGKLPGQFFVLGTVKWVD